MTRHISCIVVCLFLLAGCGGGEGPPATNVAGYGDHGNTDFASGRGKKKGWWKKMATVEYPIAASLDDGLFHYFVSLSRWLADGTGPVLIAGDASDATRNNYRSFLRWAISIPAGATINSADMYFQCRWPAEQATVFTSQIYLIDEDDCPAFDYWDTDQGNMSLVAGPVAWTPETWEPDGNYATVDISALVQAFIDRPGYSPGQYIGLFIHEGDATNNEWREIYSYDGHVSEGGDIPLLRVTYTPRVGGYGSAHHRVPTAGYLIPPDIGHLIAMRGYRFPAGNGPAYRFQDSTTSYQFVDASTTARFRDSTTAARFVVNN